MSQLSAIAINRLMTGARVPGFSMAVVSDGRTTRCITAGVRNARARIAVDRQTVFAAASLSKPLFAYAVLKLVDAGQLTLDTAFVAARPGLCARRSPRGQDHRAPHPQSHIRTPNWRSDEFPLKTYFPPGERFSYSGEGFVWLQHVVEAVTGADLETTLRRFGLSNRLA